MFFKRFTKLRKPDVLKKGCKLIPSSSPIAMKIPFSTHIIYLDANNQIGLEFNWDIRIRIDGIYTTDYGSFKTMMATLIEVSKKQGYNKLFFADSVSNNILNMLISYGFHEIPVLPDKGNHYLTYYIDEGVCA